VISVVRRIV